MKKLSDVFACWGKTPTEVAIGMAGDLGVSHWVTRKWWQRKSIPSSAWPGVIAAVTRKGKDLTADDLLRMHTRNSTRFSPIRQRRDGGDAA